MLKYALLLYMSILAFTRAASLCTPETILKRDPSVGEHPAVCGAVRLCAWKYQRSAPEYLSLPRSGCVLGSGCRVCQAYFMKNVSSSSEPQLRATTAVVQ